VINPVPVTLEGHGVRLEPLTASHSDGLAAAATDGRLWELWYTVVPHPNEITKYIADAFAGREAGKMLPWAVRELSSGTIVGSTRYHDIVPRSIGWRSDTPGTGRAGRGVG
jgi:N-acetyltransferase